MTDTEANSAQPAPASETDVYIDSVVQAAAAHGRMNNAATERSLYLAKQNLGQHLRALASVVRPAQPVEAPAGQQELPPLPEPDAYIWHEHTGERSMSLRWAQPTQWEYATKVEPLFTDDQMHKYACAALALNAGQQELREALQAAVRDLSATYEALKHGMPVVSLGQLGRLQRMRAVLSRSEAPAPEWPRPQLAKNDPNHDLVPTLRMMDGLMFNRAADEIERWRDAYWSVVSVPAKKLTVVGMGLHHNYTITTQPTCIDGQLIVHTDDPSLTAGAERSEEPAPEGKKE